MNTLAVSKTYIILPVGMEGLREIREQAGLTQAGLARRAGLRQATVSALENGRTEPRSATIQALAAALDVDPETIRKAVAGGKVEMKGASGAIGQMGSDWAFLEGLDGDLRLGLARSLVAGWTHSSTAIEGNTMSLGDTVFVLAEGLTVAGKTLREHQELHGHAQALELMAAWTKTNHPVRIRQLHVLHRAVQTGVVIDALAPVGQWKVEPNGTMDITSSGGSRWHDYAEPRHVPELVGQWLEMLARHRSMCRAGRRRSQASPLRPLALNAYTDLHLGFAAIHPYADGNGRMARLLANIPVLHAGLPPILVQSEARREYLALLGDWSLRWSQPRPGEELCPDSPEKSALRSFFSEQWKTTLNLVDEFHRRQKQRRPSGDPG